MGQHMDLSVSNFVPRLPVQAGSFLNFEERRVGGLDITIYHFRQPRRLSELQLPFKILPLRRIDVTDLLLLEVPPQQSLDSWFPGYAWSILLCGRCGGRHIGWKFTPTSPGAAEAFYALIVETVDSEEERVGARAPAAKLFESIRVVSQPLAALGLAASALQSAVAA